MITDELRERRELLGLTQKDAALLAHMPEREWRAIEAGTSDPTVGVVGRMAEALGLRLRLEPAGPTPHLHRSDELRALVKLLAAPHPNGCRLMSRRAIAQRTGVSRQRITALERELIATGELEPATMTMGRDGLARREWGVRGTKRGARKGYPSAA
jgi:transcriptional regulator with XRE-family HTH domain